MAATTEPSWGAHWDGRGVSFALRSPDATSVELLLFDRPSAARPARQMALDHRGGGRWHRYVEDLGPGQCYGYRVDGPFAPQRGHRFNPAKMLIDPYARAMTGEPAADSSLLGFDPRRGPESFDSRESVGAMPKAVVVDDAFDWAADSPPDVPWRDTVIYECHVRGATVLHPDIAPEARGRYLGLASPPMIEHYRTLGVTTLELLPVHQIASEPALRERGLRNYWGYSTLGYFAPHAGYASSGLGAQVVEFKEMVARLHAAGIEVVLDVVLNHTAEGDRHGPTLAWRGLDNAGFYRLAPANLRRYVDVSGCGNTLDVSRPAVREFVLDCLRYWVEVMHVDGFRFDLAPALGRGPTGGGMPFDARAPLLEAIVRDPVLSRVKRIAEPWDLGPGGYRLGDFGPAWAQWNDRFRQTARRYWRGDLGLAPALARELDGHDRLGGAPSIDYVTCHDGFTLRDLVTYTRKRNERNGEGNRDGADENHSHAWGCEGPTEDPMILADRARAVRNLLATLLLGPGVPMLSHGDELGRTQAGNNNAYCHDDETTWIDWCAADEALIGWVSRVIALRRDHPAFGGPPRPPNGARVLVPSGAAANGPSAPEHAVVVLFEAPGGEAALWLANSGASSFRFEPPRELAPWRFELDSACPETEPGGRADRADSMVVAARSVQVWSAGA